MTKILGRTWYIQGLLIFAFNLLICALPFVIGGLLKLILGDNQYIGALNLLFVVVGDSSLAIFGLVKLAKMWYRSPSERWGMALLGCSPYLVISYWLYYDVRQSGDALAAMGEMVLSPIALCVAIICFLILFLCSRGE